jgi:hypothetical protein
VASGVAPLPIALLRLLLAALLAAGLLRLLAAAPTVQRGCPAAVAASAGGGDAVAPAARCRPLDAAASQPRSVQNALDRFNCRYTGAQTYTGTVSHTQQ